MYAILGDPDRLQALAEDFIKHYENRITEGATVKGKAMFVSSSREIAYEFFKNVIAVFIPSPNVEPTKFQFVFFTPPFINSAIPFPIFPT